MEEAGESDDFDRRNAAAHGFPVMEREDRNNAEFRNRRLYTPQFCVPDQSDFVATMAVFLTLLLFITRSASRWSP